MVDWNGQRDRLRRPHGNDATTCGRSVSRSHRVRGAGDRPAGLYSFAETATSLGSEWCFSVHDASLCSGCVNSSTLPRGFISCQKKCQQGLWVEHLVVAASGIWIVDAKSYKGKVELRDVGGWLKTDHRLYVNGRDQSKLVGGLAKQIDAVLAAIEDADIPIKSALCFVDSEWGLFAKPFQLGGVLVNVASQALRR